MSVALAGAVLVTACSGAEFPTAKGNHKNSSAPSKNTTPDPLLQKALGRVGADAAGKLSYIEFVDRKRLTALASKDKAKWQGLETFGVDVLYTGFDYEDMLGIDLDAADYAVTAGSPPAKITLVVGGQDSSAVKSAAKEVGYKGTGVLSQEWNLEEPLTVSIAHVLAAENYVALGGRAADMTQVGASGDTLRDLAGVGEVSSCLGSVVGAIYAKPGSDAKLVGVGVQENGGNVTSVMCVKASSGADAASLAAKVKEDLASGQQKYADSFKDTSVATVGGDVVQAKLPHSRAAVGVIFGMLLNLDLPGL